jgi:hypothetical protein
VKKGINPAINLVGRECVDDLSLMHISISFAYAGVSRAFGTINRIYPAFALRYKSTETCVLPLTCSRKTTFKMSKITAAFSLSTKQYLMQTCLIPKCVIYYVCKIENGTKHTSIFTNSVAVFHTANGSEGPLLHVRDGSIRVLCL